MGERLFIQHKKKAPITHCIRGRVGHTASLDMVEKEKKNLKSEGLRQWCIIAITHFLVIIHHPAGVYGLT
jgi:hypothetical protein